MIDMYEQQYVQEIHRQYTDTLSLVSSSILYLLL